MGRAEVVAAPALAAALMIAGCGSTASVAPSAPSAVAAQPAAQYPSLVGQWGGSAVIVVQFTDNWSPSSYSCSPGGSVTEQTGGSFSGSIGLNGQSLNTDKECIGIALSFTAQMSPDGTITNFQSTGRFGSHECSPVSQVTFHNGTASDTGFKIQLTDRAQCTFPPLTDDRYPTKEAERTFTFTMNFRRGPNP